MDKVKIRKVYRQQQCSTLHHDEAEAQAVTTREANVLSSRGLTAFHSRVACPGREQHGSFFRVFLSSEPPDWDKPGQTCSSLASNALEMK